MAGKLRQVLGVTPPVNSLCVCVQGFCLFVVFCLLMVLDMEIILLTQYTEFIEFPTTLLFKQVSNLSLLYYRYLLRANRPNPPILTHQERFPPLYL